MKIVILDGYTINPGDLSWDPIRSLGESAIYDRTSPDQLLERCQEAELLFTNKISVDSYLIEQLPRLKLLGVMATGFNVVDTVAARRRNIPVVNVPNYATDSVAQLVFAHILEFCHGVGHHAQTVRDGNWSRSSDFCYWDSPLMELRGKVLGILGYGSIGQSAARLGMAFGMRVLANDSLKVPQNHPEVSWVSRQELFEQSDFLTLHCPLNDQTQGMVNRNFLQRMKKTAFLINTSRGPLIHEPDLVEALQNRWISGAGLDVLSVEPPLISNPLLKLENCWITPHYAWATQEARRHLIQIVAENIQAFLSGQPIHVVN